MENNKGKFQTQWFNVKKFLGLTKEQNITTTKLPNYTKDHAGFCFIGMTSADEQAYVQQYAETDYSGKGEIVDLGCFLGGFSIPLAKGLEANSKIEAKEGRIHAYDIFIWDEYVSQILAGHELAEKYNPGDSFLEEYIKRIGSYKHYIQIYEGDLTKIGWNGGDIEYLLVDAMKSWDLTNSIIHNFFPALIPGYSLVHHQDFSYFWTTWIHLSMYRLRHYFEPLYHVPPSSVIFKYRQAIPPEVLQSTLSFTSFSKEEIDSAFEYSINLVPKEMQINIAAAKVATYFQMNDIEQARVELKNLKIRGLYCDNSDFVQLEQWLS